MVSNRVFWFKKAYGYVIELTEAKIIQKESTIYFIDFGDTFALNKR